MSSGGYGWNHYHLVEWEKEEGEEQASVSLVPNKWLVLGTNTCKWPPNAPMAMIRRNPSPQRAWPTYLYFRIAKSSGDNFGLTNIISNKTNNVIY